MSPIPAPNPVVYPAEDAVPMGETGLHALALYDLFAQLEELFEGRADVAIEQNRFVYWAEGDPTQSVNPDLFVCLGRPRAVRDTWKTWEEGGRFAEVVFEVCSESTRRNDLGGKRTDYEMLGVQEYVVLDPRRKWIPEGLRAWRLVDGELRKLAVTDEVWLSTLGVRVVLDGSRVRIVTADGRAMLHPEEARAEIAALRARLAELGERTPRK